MTEYITGDYVIQRCDRMEKFHFNLTFLRNTRNDLQDARNGYEFETQKISQ